MSSIGSMGEVLTTFEAQFSLTRSRRCSARHISIMNSGDPMTVIY